MFPAPQAPQPPAMPPGPPPGMPMPMAPPGAPAGPPAAPPAPPQPSPQDMADLQALHQQLQQIQENRAVLDILRDERTRGFRIEIETDSTIEPDESQEKAARVEFITAIGNFMKEAMPAAQQTPQIAPMLSEMLLFLVRGFRAGRSLEDVIERTMDKLQGLADEPKPDPEAAKNQALLAQKDQQHQQQMAAAQQQHQNEMERTAAQHQQEMAVNQQQFQNKLAADQQASADKLAHDRQQAELNRADAERQHQEKLAHAQQQFHHQQTADFQKEQRDRAHEQQQREADRSDAREERMHARAHDSEKHQRDVEAKTSEQNFKREALALPEFVKESREGAQKLDETMGQLATLLTEVKDALHAPVEAVKDARTGKLTARRVPQLPKPKG